MKNMDKGHTVPKWVLIVRRKIPQMPQNLSAQFVGPSPKVMDSNETRGEVWRFGAKLFLEFDTFFDIQFKNTSKLI